MNSISIKANGEVHEVAPELPLPEFLVQLGLKPEWVVIEYNGQAHTRAEAAAIRLREGDNLEIVRIVAGG